LTRISSLDTNALIVRCKSVAMSELECGLEARGMGQAKAPELLRSSATADSVGKKPKLTSAENLAWSAA
jgi:hypothetical protein